jgi:hypothetical protein
VYVGASRLGVAVVAAGLVVWSPGPAAAQLQAEDEVSPQLWVDYNPSWQVGPRVDVFGDVSARTELGSQGWWRFVVRPSARYQFDRVQLSGGIGNFFTLNDVIADRWEIRPWQGVRFSWPRGVVPFEHLVRLEERFDFNLRTWNSSSSLRVRYRLRPSIDWGTESETRYWRALASMEIFYTLAGDPGQFEEEVRLTASVERSYRPKLRVRLDATWQKEGRVLSEGSIDDLILRFRVFSSW